jgi:hypothetical protein
MTTRGCTWLAEQQGGGRVPAVVQADVANAGLLQ